MYVNARAERPANLTRTRSSAEFLQNLRGSGPAPSGSSGISSSSRKVEVCAELLIEVWKPELPVQLRAEPLTQIIANVDSKFWDLEAPQTRLLGFGHTSLAASSRCLQVTQVSSAAL